MTEHQDDSTRPFDSTEEMISSAPPAHSTSDSVIGTKIGSCTIKRIIGFGGMGTVYEAVQEQPRRRVALKMMKRGVTSRSATHRFEFESQTLARLKHQGVAQIYEAGTHDDGSGGLPYFVMEYVANAKSITAYANDKKLRTRDRLSLFTKVCDAVQHGHLKGIVHRDLKPGNILVDSNGQPKIIDFGVARSTDSDMAVTTLQTDVGQLIGTLQYMSPEQCEADPSDIDARSDVYALGVLLYELLTGKPPYNLQRIAIHEAVRIVREEEPTKLSSINKHLRGDIETIAMKALDKDRSRRYQSATALEEDIQHYLRDEPISAKPPGAIDYLKRFARKHTAAAISLVAVFVVLAGSLVAISLYAVEAEQQKVAATFAEQEAMQEKTRAEAVKGFVTSMLSSVDPATAGALDKELMMLVLANASASVGVEFQKQPLVEAEIRSVIGNTYRELGNYTEAQPQLLASLTLYRESLGEAHHDTLASMNDMGMLCKSQGKYDEAESYYTNALDIRRRVLGNEHLDTLQLMNNLGSLLMKQRRYDEAQAYFVEVLDGYRSVLGNEHMNTLASMNNMGSALKAQEKYDEAEVYYSQALEGYRSVLGNEHPHTLSLLNNMGSLLKSQGKYEDSAKYHAEALEGRRKVLGDDHPYTLRSINNIGSLLRTQGKYEEAKIYYQMALQSRMRVLGNEHPDTLGSMNNMGVLLTEQGKYSEAEMYFTEALKGYRQTFGDEHPQTISTITDMVDLYDAWGKIEQAKMYRDMLPAEYNKKP